MGSDMTVVFNGGGNGSGEGGANEKFLDGECVLIDQGFVLRD